MTKLYATIDQTTLPALQEIQQGGLVLSCNTDATTIAFNARASQALSVSRWKWEVAPYGTAALSATNFAAGLILASSANTDWPGKLAGSVGINGAGEIWVNGSHVTTVGLPVKQQFLSFELDLVAGTPTLEIKLNGLVLYTFTLAAGQIWKPAWAVGATVAFDMNAYINLGSVALSRPPSANFKPGVYSNQITQPPFFVATQPYISPATATPPNQYFEGRISREVAKAFFVERGITFCTDGTSGTSWAAADLDLDNRDFALSGLLTNPPRGAPMICAIVDLDDPAMDPYVFATTLIDDIMEPKPGVIRIKQASQLKQHDEPGQRKVIPPWAATGAAGLVSPTALGANHEVNPLLVDELTNAYIAHDTKITNVAMARDMGDPLDPEATPPDWTMSLEGDGIQTHTTPVGTLTIDLSSRGEITPVTTTDLLAGVGLMGTSGGTYPTGWTPVPLQSHGHATWVSTGGGRMRVTYDTWTGSGYETQANVMSTPIPAATILSGKRYRISVDIKAADPGIDPARPAYFGFFVNDATGPTGLGGLGSTMAGTFADVAWGVGSFNVDFTAPFDVRYLVALATMDHPVTDPTPGSYWMEYGNITILELPDPPDPSAPLDGITLTDYMKAIIETRGGFDSSVWSSADTAAIDTTYPFTFGCYFPDRITREAMIRAPLDSFGASITEDEAGTLRFPVLIDPDTIADVDLAASFERWQIEAMPLGSVNKAPGLTTNWGVRPNNYIFTDGSQFVADFDPTTGISAATRAQFMRAAQYNISSAVNLHQYYDFARGAEQMVTKFEIKTDGQTRLDQICGLFTRARLDWPFIAHYDTIVPPSILPGKGVKVTWAPIADDEPAHPTFATGKNLLVKRVRHFPFAMKFEFLSTMD